MIRFVMATALVVGSAAQAETKAERKERCELQGTIVTMAVEFRNDNKRSKRAIRLIKKDEGIAGSPHEGIVDVLVPWIYTLPPVQLTPEATEAFVEACVAHEQ
ncbi:MAG: hypothetical protein JXR13_12345 [Thalassovita sp.]